MTPAMTAVDTIGPFFDARSPSFFELRSSSARSRPRARSVSGGRCTKQRACASRMLTALSPTSTIRALPSVSTCVSGLMSGSTLFSPPLSYPGKNFSSLTQFCSVSLASALGSDQGAAIEGVVRLEPGPSSLWIVGFALLPPLKYSSSSNQVSLLPLKFLSGTLRRYDWIWRRNAHLRMFITVLLGSMSSYHCEKAT
eukprot:CAMPEP_0185756220 /NCGR_PEP_ID=MMETSP1174-20130828/14646_1 /TAXON_ID=35687 /ORGANISM="Dictyocha speculum, Strain CCMP1381" /LENGTH=196 /DNA_ID=CAMNT_0028435087 /DNA_START=627 /DNA_END=1213 /DNA_ORIENTATION=-